MTAHAYAPLHSIPGGRATVDATPAQTRPALPPPTHDLRAEETLLCALLDGTCVVDDVIGYLKPEHFYAPANRYLFEAILAAAADGMVVDETTVFAKLRASGRVVDVGGVAGIARVIDNNPSDGAALSYVRIILDCWALREVGKICRDVQIQSRQPVASVETLLADLRRQVEALSDTCKVNAAATDLCAGLVADAREDEARAARGPVLFCPTGYPSLDNALGGGWPREWLVVVGAQSETGKTAFAIEACVACASHAAGGGGGAALYLSAELTQRQARQRFTSNVSGLSKTEVDKMAHPGRLAQAQTYLATLPIYTEEIRKFSEVRREVRKHHRLAEAAGWPLKLVVIDFLQYLEPDAPDPKGNRETELAGMMQAMKNLRSDYPETAFVVLSQINAAGQMRGSGAIAHPADQTIYLKRPDPKDKSIVHLELDKGRGVSPIGGPVELSMDPVSGRLTEGQP